MNAVAFIGFLTHSAPLSFLESISRELPRISPLTAE
jgi:hypothetical protein